MRNIIRFLVIPIFLLLIFTSSVLARENRTSRVITLPPDEVVTRDFYVTGGDIVEISGTVNGDVIVGAGQLIIDGTVNGDVLVAGGTVDVSGFVRDDARILGGQIDISGEIGRNLTVAGGDIAVIDGAVIGGGVVIGGGNVKLAGEVGGDVLIAAGNIILANKVAGDVEIYTGTVRATSNAEIDGDFIYTSEEEALIDKGATISGKLLRKTAPQLAVDTDVTSFQNVAKKIFAFRLEAKFISFLSALIVGMIILKLFPKYLKTTDGVFKDVPWKALLYGVLFLLLMPFAIIILFVTIIGIPLAFFGIMAMGTFIYLSKIFIGNWLGSKIPIGDKNNVYLSFTLGLAAYYLITIIPVLGGFAQLAVLLFGMGAGLLACKDYYKSTNA